MNNKTVNHLFVCECGDVDHQFIIAEPPTEWFDEFEDSSELWVHIHLRRDLTWFQKLKYIILYILGKQSIYGAFGEIILKKEQITRLRDICNDFLQKTNKDQTEGSTDSES